MNILHKILCKLGYHDWIPMYADGPETKPWCRWCDVQQE